MVKKLSGIAAALVGVAARERVPASPPGAEICSVTIQATHAGILKEEQNHNRVIHLPHAAVAQDSAYLDQAAMMVRHPDMRNPTNHMIQKILLFFAG